MKTTTRKFASRHSRTPTLASSLGDRTEIERSMRSLWVNSYDGRNFVVALDHAAYFDRTHNNKSKLTLVGGYLGTVDEWSQFETEWRLTLAKYDVSAFHMKHFISHRKPFDHEKWTVESYRAEFISKLVAIINDWTVSAVACAVRQDVLDSVNSQYELDKRFNPYALCGRNCAVASKLIIRELYGSDRPIAFYFDRGDEGWGMLDAEMVASKLPSPQKRKSRPDGDESDVTDPPAIPLQACDFAAWEIRRGREDQDVGKVVRKSLAALIRTTHRWTEYKQSDLLRFCKVAKINRRNF